jgi:hypothetical protein
LNTINRFPHGDLERPMENFEPAVVTAHFLAGDRIELIAVDAIPRHDPENGDAEFYRQRARLRAVLDVARRLKRCMPKAKFYVA